jgi:hypothetical protein
MNRRTGIILGIIIVVLSVIVGVMGYQFSVNQRLAESDRIAEEESDRVVDPLPEMDTSTMEVEEIQPIELPDPDISERETFGNIQSPSTSAPQPQPQRFSGIWQSHQDYISTGSVTITEVDDGYIIQFSDDYTFSGAPDPFLYLSADNSLTLDNALVIGKLQSENGAQAYKVTKDEFERYNAAIYIWCRAFDLYMGQAIIV